MSTNSDLNFFQAQARLDLEGSAMRCDAMRCDASLKDVCVKLYFICFKNIVVVSFLFLRVDVPPFRAFFDVLRL